MNKNKKECPSGQHIRLDGKNPKCHCRKWEEEFRDFYWEIGKYEKRLLGIDSYIGFISQLLLDQKEEIIKKIRKLKIDEKNESWKWNDAIKDIITLIKI